MKSGDAVQPMRWSLSLGPQQMRKEAHKISRLIGYICGWTVPHVRRAERGPRETRARQTEP